MLVLFVLAWPAAAHGQKTGLAPISPSKTYASRLRWMQYNMVGGRVVVSSAYQGTNMTFGPSQVERRSEFLQIHINTDQINFRYELTDADEQLTIALAEGNQLSIRRNCSDPKYALRFEQSLDAPLLLTLETANTRYTLRGDSFWHLYLAEPQLVRRHLVPLMDVLHPSWQLSSMGAAVEDALVQRAQNPRQFAGKRWARLVDDLASPRFSERQSAQQELYSAGPVIVPYLQNLDRTRLDAEQASRIRTLVESLCVDYEDTTDRIATWLAGDEQVWLSLLSRGEVFKRRAAKEQLSLLLGTPIEFDPAAEESQRNAEIQRLRVRLQKPTPDITR